MADYRRVWVQGGTYFFTVNLRDRREELLVQHIGALREAVRREKARAPFQIDAWVVLPEHMHCIWTLPQGDADFATRWGMIKASFSRLVPGGTATTASRARRGERGIWQRRFWEHCIRDETDFGAHMDYVHFNPVRHGLVRHPGDWPYSTFRRCVAMGMYPPDWAGSGDRDWIGERR